MKLTGYAIYPPEIPVQGEFAILSHAERTMLHHVISQLDNNSNIVEVGSALGGAACIMAATNSTINVLCIEPFHNNIWSWQNQIRPYLTQHIEGWCKSQKLSKNHYLFLSSSVIPHIDLCFERDPLGILAFNFITNQFPNIKLLQGESPNICADWTTPIDLYFEDAMHTNPVLHSNIDFWTKHIKPNGFIIGHDYNELCPDVVSEFNNLIQQGWSLIAKVEYLIVLQKPNTIAGNN